MVKVCHVTSAHCSNDVRIFYKECASLAKAGYETYLVARGESREENGVHVIGVGQAPSNRIGRMTRFSRKVYEKALAVDANIYHLHDPELLPWGTKLKKRGKKVIFDSHEKYVDQIKNKQYLPKGIKSCVAFAYKAYEESVLQKIDAVIFPCLANGKHPFEGKCRKAITVDNFPILEELYNQYDVNIQKEKNALCYTGSLTHNRGITNLVEAMEFINGRLYLAGDCPSEAYIEKLKTMPGWEKVEYLGHLNRDEVRRLIQKCEIGMSANLSVGQYNKTDNFSTKDYEYMSLGIPVVLTDGPYNKLAEEYRFGVCVDPEDIEEYADKVNKLLEDKELIQQLGVNGRKAVARFFNWETQAEKLVRLYRELDE